jgi:hypothetical protein
MAYVDITDAFCGSPETFMANNVVMQWIQHEKDEIIKVGVRYIEGATVQNKPNGKACFFYIKKEPPCLSVYWCPYAQNSLKSAMLGNDALFAMTPAVTGCSVGIGMGANGNQMMCHVNSAQIGNDWKSVSDAEARARQAQSQDAQLRYKLGQGLSLASPTEYRAGDLTTMVTFYAVHGLNLPWKLHGLSYRKTGGTQYMHDGVIAY